MKTLRRLFRIAQVKRVAFSGGEPLLSERLFEQILFCRMKKADVSLISNGMLLDDEAARVLTSLGVSLVSLPFHSHDPAIHDGLTGVEGSHARAVQALASARNAGLATVSVIVVTRANLPGLDPTLRALKELGQDRVMLNRYNVGGPGIGDPAGLLPSREELRSGWRLANRLAGDLGLAITSNVCTPVCILDPRDYPALGFGRCGTGLRQLPLTLDPAGNVRACNHSPHAIGNIFTSSLERMATGTAMDNWRGNRPEPCATCGEYDRCRGGCRAAAEQLGGNFADPDPALALTATTGFSP